ncbi:LLM class flavin-dependent oxidoreductase [Haliea sp. E17]|uniref:LLM class flavin-dependent oxidoreductase n=1 Tax=Haliea sp. E17 TaxID=3401576 RepID=UPI003AAFEA92
MIEFWCAGGSVQGTSADLARQREAEGWDGQMFMDSQSLSADPWALMGAWAIATERLQLSTGVTNPLTRHPAVTAACAATIQSIAGGRAVLGIGRGDSALAYLGRAPSPLSTFESTLCDLQTLLSGGAVDFTAAGDLQAAGSVETLSLGHRPEQARLKWLPGDLPKVPLDVAATGPKVIRMAACIAERVTFSVGAIPERVQWALETARRARAEAGMPADGVSYGIQVIVVCHPDLEAVREAATSFVAPLARFQIMLGEAAGPRSENDAENLAKIRAGYDMTVHGDVEAHDRLGGAQLDFDFVRRFAIVGSPEHCVERLLQLHRLGIERFVVVGPGFHPELERQGPGLFVREVLAAVRNSV